MHKDFSGKDWDFPWLDAPARGQLCSLIGDDSVMMGAVSSATAAYLVEQSLLFDGAAYLSRTPGSAGNTKVGGFDAWVKRGTLGATQNILTAYTDANNYTVLQFNSDDTLQFYTYSSGYDWRLASTAKFRDTGAWMHVAARWDTTPSTPGASDIWIAVNGTILTAFSVETYPSQNFDLEINAAKAHQIGSFNGASAFFNGVMALPRLIDGAAPAITDLLTFNDDNTIQPKEFTGTTTQEQPDLTGSSNIGNMTGGGGLAAAFDGTTSQASTAGAALNNSASDGTVGKDWGSGNTKTINKAVIIGPNDTSIVRNSIDSQGATTVYLEASTDNFSASTVTLASTSTSTASAEVLVLETTGASAYRYHRIRVAAIDGSSDCFLAEVQFYEDTANSFGTNGFVLSFSDSTYLGKAKDETGTVTVSSSGEWSGDTGNWTLTGDDASAGVVTSAIYSSELTGDFFVKMTMSGGSTSNRVGIVASSEIGTLTTTAEANDYGMANMTDSFYANFGTSQFVYGGSNQSSMSPNGDGVITLQRQSDTILITVDDGQDSHIFTQTFSGAMRIVLAGNSARAFNDMFWFDDLVFPFYDTYGFTAADQLADSPTDDAALGIGNACVLNPNDRDSGVTLSEANLTAEVSSDEGVRGTIFFDVTDSDGFIFEFTCDSSTHVNNTLYGIANANFDVGGLQTGSDFVGYFSNGNKYAGGSTSSYGNSFTDADVITLVVKGGAVWAAKNGTWQNSATQGEIEAGTTTNALTTGLTGFYAPLTHEGSATNRVSTFNAGQRAFTATIPSGVKKLMTQDLSAAAIPDPSAHFNTVLYTGNGTAIGSGGNAITGVGFQPDFAWIKNRSQADNHMLYDAVRGVTKDLHSNTADTEATDTEGLSTFDSDGFTVGSNVEVNTNTENYVAWCWKANGAGSSNTDGSITSTVSANTTAGFSIVSYTGTGAAATVGHGLGVAPDFAIFKSRTQAGQDWLVGHSSLNWAGDEYLFLNSQAAKGSAGARWNTTAPTSSVISLGTGGENNGSGQSIIAYCWNEVEGFSKFGSYIGNGSADGPFVYTGGFKPAFTIIKQSSAAGSSWVLHDAQRDTYNVVGQNLFADTSAAESTFALLDYLSNGIKIRSGDSSVNASGQTYIYAAFAEAPFQGGATEVTQGRAR